LISALLLALYDFTKTFKIEYDDLCIGIGAVLIQQKQPITYFSEKLNETTFNYPIYDKIVCISENLDDLATLSLA
jgi:hypothetical protein